MLRLNLGCAVVKLDGYVNVDLYVEADLQHDLREPLPYPDGSVDEILASHVLEHFGYQELKPVLKDWHRVLADKGFIVIRVPNLLNIFRKLQRAEENDDFSGYMRHPAIDNIYGGQWNEGEFHKNGFTPKRLFAIMDKYGFKVKNVLPPRDKDPDEIHVSFVKK